MRYLLLAVIGFCTSSLSAYTNAEWHSAAWDIMGTRIEATVWHTDLAQAERALNIVREEMTRIDANFSPYIDTSELSRLNREAPKATAQRPVTISAELTLLLDKSLYYSRLTDGAFDVTYASLGRYYNYRTGIQPEPEAREVLLPAIDYRLIHLNTERSQVWFERPEVYVDLGGIAKGYAVDLSVRRLRAMGIEHASISAGGDSRLLGDHRGRPWMVGIKNPRDTDSVAITLPLDSIAISTSGDYERYFVNEDGERIHHIMNPRTGTPATGIASATVIGPRGFDTDPLSTAVFVLGVEAGMALLNRLSDFDGIIITTDGKVHYSDGLSAPTEAPAE